MTVDDITASVWLEDGQFNGGVGGVEEAAEADGVRGPQRWRMR